LAHAPQHTDRVRRWVRPNQPRVYDTPPTGTDPPGTGPGPQQRRSPAAGRRPPQPPGSAGRAASVTSRPATRHRLSMRFSIYPRSRTARASRRPFPSMTQSPCRARAAGSTALVDADL